MGGAVAAAVAAEHPDRVSALVLIDAAGFNLEPGAGPPLLRLVTSPVAALLEPLPGKRLIVEKALREVFYDERHVTDERLAEYLSGALRPGGLAARHSLLMSLQGRAAVVQEGLPRIEAPTLIVWGREDRWIPVAHAKLFADAIPGARTVVLEACGHVPQEERPEELGGLVAAFLAGLEDRAAPGGPTDARE
jgi:pimeloyl-ACP methyl ester carboxylesterase